MEPPRIRTAVSAAAAAAAEAALAPVAAGNNGGTNNDSTNTGSPKSDRYAARKAMHKAALKAARAVPVAVESAPGRALSNRVRGALVAAARAQALSSAGSSPAPSCPGTPSGEALASLASLASQTSSAATTPKKSSGGGGAAAPKKAPCSIAGASSAASETVPLDRAVFDAAVQLQRAAKLGKKKGAKASNLGNKNKHNNSPKAAAATDGARLPASPAPATAVKAAAAAAAAPTAEVERAAGEPEIAAVVAKPKAAVLLVRATSCPGSSISISSISSSSGSGPIHARRVILAAAAARRPDSCPPARSAAASAYPSAPRSAFVQQPSAAVLAAAAPFEVVPGLYRASGPTFGGLLLSAGAGLLLAAPALLLSGFAPGFAREVVVAEALYVPSTVGWSLPSIGHSNDNNNKKQQQHRQPQAPARPSALVGAVAGGALSLAEAACAASATLGARCVERALLQSAPQRQSSLLGLPLSLAARGCKAAVGTTAVVAGLGGVAAAKALRGLFGSRRPANQ